MNDFNWNTDNVEAATKKIIELLKGIEEQSDQLISKSNNYGKSLKDNVSADANKCIRKIKEDAIKMHDDLQKRIQKIIESNALLKRIENEDRIKV